MPSFESLIRAVPDFPKPGVVFRDITPLLADAGGFARCIDAMAEPWQGSEVQAVCGIESRGFLFAAPVATRLRAALVLVRKPGKLPRATVREDYALEYGTNALELHRDAIARGERVVVVDDLLATGGTILAAIRLVEALGGVVAGLAFVVELGFLGGRARLDPHDVVSLVTFD